MGTKTRAQLKALITGDKPMGLKNYMIDAVPNLQDDGTPYVSGDDPTFGDVTVTGVVGVTVVQTNAESLVNSKNVGAAGAATAVVTERGDGVHHVTLLTLTDFVIGPLAGAAAAKVLVPPTALYVLPAGVQVIKYAYMSLALTAAGTAQTPELGLGSIIGDGSANADIGTAGATQEDYFIGTAGGNTDTHAAVVTGPLGATAGVLTGIALNKAADSKNIFLNCADTWAADNTGNITATGTVVIVWDFLA